MTRTHWLGRPQNRLLLAGWLFTAGNYSEIVSSQYTDIVDLIHGRLDLAHTDIGQLAGALLYLACGHILACSLGSQQKWFVFSSVLAIAALLSTNATALADLPNSGWCALGGSVLYTLSYGIGSALIIWPMSMGRGDLLGKLSRRPRRLMGIGGAMSMLFSLPDALNPLLAAVFVAWLSAEFLLAFTDEK
jgi:hypothetical protein